MDRVVVLHYGLGLLGLLLLQGALTVEGRSVFNPGDADAQSRILALLLHKGLTPVERDDRLGLELERRLSELQELRALKEDVELEKELAANLVEDERTSMKRGESCFWKYCV